MDITEILMAATALILALAAFTINHTAKTDAKRAEALKWVGIAVNAVEQVSATATGRQKKSQVKAWLAKQGLIYDEAKLDMAIEAEVNKMKKTLGKKE
ncbi:phage holin, LLH family [Peptococcus simiae]|uniref:phage holin, LLH family n=1 Tax=Peptococcus simiae TaxID=1643805 RepID=UPI00397FEFDE